MESLVSTEGPAVLRLSLAGVSAVLFLSAFVVNRRALVGSARPVIGTLFLVVSALFLYAGGVHLPLGPGEEAFLVRATNALFSALEFFIYSKFKSILKSHVKMTNDQSKGNFFYSYFKMMI